METEKENSVGYLRLKFSEDVLPLLIKLKKAINDSDETLEFECRDEIANRYFDLDKKLRSLDSSSLLAFMNKYQNRGVDRDDILTFAEVGLIKACDSYDPDNKAGASFYTYSYVVMEQEILNSLDKSSIVPVSLLKRKKMIDKAENMLSKKLDHVPSDDEIYEVLSKESDKITMKSIKRLRGINIATLYQLGEVSDNGTSRNGIKDDDGCNDSNPEQVFLDDFERQLIKKFIFDENDDQLNDQEKMIAKMIFYEDKSLSSICKETSLNRSEVETIKKNLLSKVKSQLIAK